MTKQELDSLTVVRAGNRVELVNSSGHVAYFSDRDKAYDRVRELRRKGPTSTRRAKLKAKQRLPFYEPVPGRPPGTKGQIRERGTT